MKIALSVLLVCLPVLASFGQAEGTRTLEFAGYWQGGDLYIQNPYSRSFKGYCAMEVYVNGRLYHPNANTSAIYVPLEDKGFSINEHVTIKIIHNNDCRPKIVNKHVLSPTKVVEEEEAPAEELPTEDPYGDYFTGDDDGY